MVGRLDRGRQILDPVTPRVDDGKTQRALDSLQVALREVIKFLSPFIQPEKWVDLDLWSDWSAISTNLEPPQQTVDALGRAELRGWAITAAGSSSTVAVLPQGRRPRNRLSFGCACQSGGSDVFGRVDVYEDGRVLLASPPVGAGTAISLSNIRFDTRV